MDIRYEEWQPGADLRNAVTAYWGVEGDGRSVPFPAILPDGHVELVFNLGDPVALAGPAYTGPQPERSLVGPLSRAVRMACGGRTRMFGVRFHPACGPSFFRRRGTDLVDRLVPLARIDPALDANLCDLRLEGADLATESGRAPLDRLLAERWRSSNPPAADLVALVDRLRESPISPRVGDMARALGTSARHLQRRFLEAVGMPPKRFARVVRFTRVWRLAAMSPVEGWAGLAADHGFADQAHLIREFRAFGAEPPTRMFGPDWREATEMTGLETDASEVRSVQDERLRRAR